MAADGMSRRDGLLAGLASYVMWGFFPLYFILLGGVHPLEIVAQRVVWAALVLVVVIAVTRQAAALRQTFWDSSARTTLVWAALLIGVVWFFYGYGALTQRAVDVALGYFICPLVTVLLAVVLRHERLRAAQWSSAGIGALAVVVVTTGQGRFPWLSIVIALAFGLYSYAKNALRADLSATVGLTLETVWLVPVSALLMVWLYGTGRATFAVGGIDATDLWLLLSGPLTVVPLLLFAMAASRLPLSMIGNLQYLNPALQLVAGVLVLREDMPATRWAGFALVWLALAVLVIDAGFARKRSARAHVPARP